MSIQLDPPGNRHRSASQGSSRCACMAHIHVRHRRGKQAQTRRKCLFRTAPIPTPRLLLSECQCWKAKGHTAQLGGVDARCTHGKLTASASINATGKGAQLQLLYTHSTRQGGHLTGRHLRSPERQTTTICKTDGE